MVGCSAFLPEDNLDELDETQFYYHEIIGFDVEDQQLGKLGKVKTVYTMPIQDLIAMPYNGHEVLIPVNDEIIPKVNREAKILYVNLPEGLLEVYTSDQKEESDEN